MLKFPKLCRNRIDPARVREAKRVHANAAGKVDIGFSRFIVTDRAAAVVEQHRKTVIGMRDIRFVLLFHCFKTHVIPSFVSKDLGGSASKPPQGAPPLDPFAAKLRFAETF